MSASSRSTSGLAKRTWRDRMGLALCLVLIALVGVLDYLTGSELRIYPLYMLPISLVSWRGGLGWGAVASFIATAAWAMSNRAAGLEFSTTIWALNATAQLVAFATVVVLVAYLQRSQAAQRELARLDGLTGLLNRRAFNEMVAGEFRRAQRYHRPLALAYLDLDNFKEVNDRHGHTLGDVALREVAVAVAATLRSTDVLSRLGGDEFAILLPETDHELSVEVLQRVHAAVALVMSRNDWPVTCSIGAVSLNEPAGSVDRVIGLADALMYEVKHSGKNSVRVVPVSPELKSEDGPVGAGGPAAPRASLRD